MTVSAVIGAALWQYAYDYGEFSHSASAKSPNPGQGYLARRHHDVGIMRIAATAPIIESLPSIRLAPSRGDCHHHGGNEQMLGRE